MRRLALLAFVGSLPLVLGSCQSFTEAIARPFGKGDAGLQRVDELVDRIERAHVEAEVGKLAVHEVLEALQALAKPGFDGDPLQAHARCRSAVDRAKEQSTRLARSVDEMERAARSFFLDWQRRLDSFVSAELRERSRARMDATRTDYRAIVDALVPARERLDSFQQRSHDLVQFLGNDLNAASVSAIEGDLRLLTDQAAALATELDRGLSAAETYIERNALPGHSPAEVEEPEESAAARR